MKGSIFYVSVLLLLCGCELEKEEEVANKKEEEVANKKCPDLSNIEVLVNAVNSARSIPRMCGTTSYNAAPPLKWNDKLAVAAKSHSSDMAQNNFFEHTGSNGLKVWDRSENAGYNNRTSSGENIYAGLTTLEGVMSGWLESPGHCANIMNPSYKDYALACVDKEKTDYETYWTQVFGTQKE